MSMRIEEEACTSVRASTTNLARFCLGRLTLVASRGSALAFAAELFFQGDRCAGTAEASLCRRILRVCEFRGV
jgi:hypothetical protein